MSNFFWSVLAVVIISLLSFVGALSFFIKEKLLQRILFYTVAFAAGSMIGAAMFHLLPEALDTGADALLVFALVVAGFLVFFVLERYLRWRHCHEEGCSAHEHLGWMNLIGDALHNTIDGMIVFAAFAGGGPALGIPVVISIILHEVPQELSDFGVLLYSGFSRAKALLFNLISALFALAGVLLAYFIFGAGQFMEICLLPLAAGGFLYIAASDLVPEIHKEKRLSKSIISFLLFVLALVFMYFMKVLFE